MIAVDWVTAVGWMTAVGWFNVMGWLAAVGWFSVARWSPGSSLHNNVVCCVSSMTRFVRFRSSTCGRRRTKRTPRHPLPLNGDASGAEGGDDSGQQRGAMWSGPGASTPVRSARKKCSPTRGYSFFRPTLSRTSAPFPCRCARPCRCASSLWLLCVASTTCMV